MAIRNILFIMCDWLRADPGTKQWDESPLPPQF